MDQRGNRSVVRFIATDMSDTLLRTVARLSVRLGRGFGRYVAARAPLTAIVHFQYHEMRTKALLLQNRYYIRKHKPGPLLITQ